MARLDEVKVGWIAVAQSEEEAAREAMTRAGATPTEIHRAIPGRGARTSFLLDPKHVTKATDALSRSGIGYSVGVLSMGPDAVESSPTTKIDALLKEVHEVSASFKRSALDEKLSRYYYVQFATILKQYARERIGQEIARELSDFFASENPQFDKERFLRAAGVREPAAEPEPEPEPAGIVANEELTRRYYARIAEILRPYARERVGREIARDFARFLGQDNPEFDRERFMRAAGVTAPASADEEKPSKMEAAVQASWRDHELLASGIAHLLKDGQHKETVVNELKHYLQRGRYNWDKVWEWTLEYLSKIGVETDKSTKDKVSDVLDALEGSQSSVTERRAAGSAEISRLANVAIRALEKLAIAMASALAAAAIKALINRIKGLVAKREVEPPEELEPAGTQGESDGKPERSSYSFGMTPENVIRERLPETYNMELTRRDVVSVLKAIHAAGDREFLERFIEEQLGGGELEKFVKNPKEMLAPKSSIDLGKDDMVKLLTALAGGDDDAMMLRSDILSTLDIEEV